MKKSINHILVLIMCLVVVVMLGACSSGTGTTPESVAPVIEEEKEFVLDKTANMVIAYKAGGGSDRMFRGFQPYLEKAIGKTINPVYLPGAEGLIGWTSLLNSPADGYTIGVLNIPSSTSSIISGDASFDVDSFEYLGNITYEPPLLAIATDNAWGIKNLDDFITYAKENPGKVTIGHSGTGSDEYIAIRIMAERAGIEVKDVPFDDTATASATVLGGHVYAQMTSAFAVLNLLDQDQLIGLAMGSEERAEEFPDIQTFKENGINLVIGGMRGLVGPKGMPEKAIEFWVGKIKEFVESKEYKAACIESSTMLKYIGPEEFKTAHENLYQDYLAQWEKAPW